MPNVINSPIVNSRSQTLAFSAGQLMSYSVRETAGARAVFRLRDGSDSSDPTGILQTVSLAPGESARESFQPYGIGFAYGLYFELLSGQVEGSVQVMTGRAE